MPGSAKVEVVGVKETLRALRELDPEYKRQFNKDIRGVVAPMVSAAKSAYPMLPISGMARQWSGRLPWNAQKVRSGVKVKSSTRRNANSVVYISQGSAAGAIFEVVTTGTQFGAAIRGRNAKVLWPTYDRYAAQIEAGVAGIVRDAEKTVQERMPAIWR